MEVLPKRVGISTELYLFAYWIQISSADSTDPLGVVAFHLTLRCLTSVLWVVMRMALSLNPRTDMIFISSRRRLC